MLLLCRAASCASLRLRAGVIGLSTSVLCASLLITSRTWGRLTQQVFNIASPVNDVDNFHTVSFGQVEN
jgi:hypothetical protein